MRFSGRKQCPGTSQREQQLQQLNCTLDWMQSNRCQLFCFIVAKLEVSVRKTLPARDYASLLTYKQSPGDARE